MNYKVDYKKENGSTASQTISQQHLLSLEKAFYLLRRAGKIVFAIIVICTVSFFLYAEYMMAPEYKAIAQMIVFTKNSAEYSYSELQLSQKMTTTYTAIINSKRVSDLVLQRINYRISRQEYERIVHVSSQQNTEIMNISVLHKDPSFATTLANEIATVFLNEIISIVDVDNVKLLTTAKIPEEPVGPSVLRFTIIGFGVGFGISGILLLLILLFDDKVTSTAELQQLVPYKILAIIPQTKKRKHQTVKKEAEATMLQKEAFRVLRTNLLAFDNNKIKVIHMLSTQQKDVSDMIIHTAIALSQIGKNVLVIDLDLRKPELHDKLQLLELNTIVMVLDSQLDLSDVLCDVIQNYQNVFDVITSKESIHNASELLQSERLTALLKLVKNKYDYILVQSAPLGTVADGIIVSRIVDGNLIVLENCCHSYQEIHQMVQMIESNRWPILGSIIIV